MSISTVNVVVPNTGDGPIASIVNLVGEKTVELSGTYVGRYTLLGTQNGTSFVPVAVFDSDGKDNIKVTVKLALSAVRVRSEAVGTSNVTMNVSGVLSAGNNKLATIATILAGSSGIQPVVDLFTVFPPSGIEQDIGFICLGTFSDLLSVEGSMNGVDFNPIGSGFRAAKQPIPLLGASPTLEFSPLTTTDLVRYVRVNLNGVALTDVIVTVGGSVPASGGGSVTTPMPIFVTDAAAIEYQAASTIIPATMGVSSFVGGDGVSVSPVGNSNFVAIGTAIVIPANSISSSVILGDTISTGNANTIANTLIGRQISQGSSSSSCVQIGDILAIGDGSDNGVCIGRQSTIVASATGCIALGFQNTVGLNNGGTQALSMGIGANTNVSGVKIVAIGTDVRVTPSVLTTDPQQVSIGHGHIIVGTMPGSIVIGTGFVNTTDWSAGTNNLDHACVAIGTLAGVASDATVTASVLMGVPTLSSANTNYGIVIAIGFNTLVTTDDATDRLEVIGTLNTLNGKFLSCFGHNNTLGGPTACLDVVVVGENCSVSEGCSDIVAIGDGAVMATTGQRYIVNIGRSNSIVGAPPNGSITEKIVCIGAFNAMGGASSPHLITMLGSDNTLGEGSVRVVSIGSSNSLGTTLDTVAVVGASNSVVDGYTFVQMLGSFNSLAHVSGTVPAHIVCIGDGNVLTDPSLSCSVVIGTPDHLAGVNTVTSLVDSVVIGQGNSVSSNTAATQTIVIGATNSVSSDTPASGSLVVIGGSNTLTSIDNSIVIGFRNSNLPLGTSTVISIGNDNAFDSSAPVIVGSNVTMNSAEGVAFGNLITFDLGSRGIAIGLLSHITSTTSHQGIAIGRSSTAGNNQCVLGSNTSQPTLEAMHQFVVRGYLDATITTIDTISAIDNPAAGSTGLTIVYNAAGTFTNKTMSAVTVATIADLTGKLVCFLS